MKTKITFFCSLAIVVLSFLFQSCKKDETPADAEKLIGTYSVHDIVTGASAGTYDYDVTVTQSSTDKNNIIIKGFGGWTTAEITATASDGSITIASQESIAAGGNISGSGTYDKTSFALTHISWTGTYTGGATDNGNATYTKK